MFQFTGFPSHTLFYSCTDDRSLSCRVPPFRYPWILTYLQLPKAFRSLSRLSSALSAKASTLRSFLYDLRHYHSVGILFFVYKVFSLFLGCLESSFKTSDILICVKFSRYIIIKLRSNHFRMETKRFELSTPCLQGRCSPN